MSSKTHPDLDLLSRKIVYKSRTFDPSTRLPLIILNSAAFPKDPDEYISSLMEKIILQLPETPYGLVFFACGAPDKPSWTWISRVYGMLDRQIKKRVGKIYVVHESWWLKAVTEMFRGIVSKKFKHKIQHVPNLTELAKLIDITQIDIPPEIYKYNLKYESSITVPKHHSPIFGVPLKMEGTRVLYPKMWKECIEYLEVTAHTTRNIFQVEENDSLLLILRDCYDRGQLLKLDDYGPHLAASVIKLYLKELPNPLLPIKYIPLPIRDTVEYSVQVFQSLPDITQKFYKDLLPLLIAVIENSEVTCQSLKTLSSNIAPSFIGRYASNKEHLSIAIRFTKNLIEYWFEITRSMDFDSDNYYSSDDESMETHRETYVALLKPTSRKSSGTPSEESIKPGLRRVSSSISYASTASTNSSLYRQQKDLIIRPLDKDIVIPIKSRNTLSYISKSEECLPVESESSFSFTLPYTPPPPPPPPPPPLRKAASIAFRNDDTGPKNLAMRKSMSNLRDQAASSVSVNRSTKRGKMVAELAKLYEVKEENGILREISSKVNS